MYWHMLIDQNRKKKNKLCESWVNAERESESRTEGERDREKEKTKEKNWMKMIESKVSRLPWSKVRERTHAYYFYRPPTRIT